jgi:hypothetical protein
VKCQIVDTTRSGWRKPATIWTRDGVITCTTKAYQWAVGKSFEELNAWWQDNGREVVVVGAETMPPGYFHSHQIPVLRQILADFFGLNARAAKAQAGPRPVVYFGRDKTITMSRARSARGWKVLVKRLFTDRTPAQISEIVRNCRYTTYHYHLNKGRP